MKLIRTNSSDKNFIELVKELDAYLKITDGDDHTFYNQYNGLEDIKHVLIVYNNEEAIGCGAFKKFSKTTAEIKRMYVKPKVRGKGFATQILKELEVWADQEGFYKVILETGDRQVEAVKFYYKSGYKRIPNYGQYAQMENSNCFEKKLK